MADPGAESVTPLNLVFTTKELNVFVENLLTGRYSQPDVVPSTPTTAQRTPGAEGESSSTTNLMSSYLNLPHHLKSCLDYCYFIINNSLLYEAKKYRLACLLLAEGLIKHDNSSTLKEDVASTVIDQLIGLGMLQKPDEFLEWVRTPSSYKKLRIGSADSKNLFAKAPDSTIRLYMVDGGKDNLYPDLSGLTITSLFDLRSIFDECICRAYMERICKLKSLVVLDLEGDIECLPDEIGDLVHLKYLRLTYDKVDVTHRHGTRKSVHRSFEMMFCHVDELPAEEFDVQRLWHLMLNRNTFNSKAGIPKKIGLKLNLHTLTGISRGGITSELSKFTQLRRLQIDCVCAEHATELCGAIMKMTYLLSLSMEAERTTVGEGKKKEVVALLPELEAFSPPPRLQEVQLTGQLVDIPSWLFSMENLSTLYLSDSYLHDDSLFVLQFLSNLKHLYLHNPSKAKQLGEEFCQAGGFPKLETLCIESTLVEWTKIANGAFPSLRSLTVNCFGTLMFFPNGLQNISTLDELYVFRMPGDLERRLQGNENYKIKNIPKVVLRSETF